MPEDSHARHLGERLLEQLQTLRDQFRAEEGRPCEVRTWPSEAGHEPVADRIPHGRRHDGDRGGRLLSRTGPWRSPCDDEVGLETGELSGQTGEALDLPVRLSVLNQDVLTLHVALLP